MITIQEASKKTGITRSTLYKIVYSGKLKYFRFGASDKGRIMLDEKDLDAFIASCAVTGPVAKEFVDEHEGKYQFMT